MILEHGLFGTKHIIILVVCFIAICLGYYFSRKLSLKTIYKIMLGIGIVSEVIKVFYFTVINTDKFGGYGYLPKTDLPFHLCSIQIIFTIIVVMSTNESLKRKLMSFMMPTCLFGGFFALLIATHSSRNGLWLITLQYFGYHCAIMILALHLFTTKELEWKFKDFLSCLALLGIFGILSIYINGILHDGSNGLTVNFMYTAGPPQEGLPYLNLDQGWLMYIVKYAALALVLLALCYIKPIINKIRGKEIEA